MFGDFNGMLGKLKETKQQIEQTKLRLNTILVDAVAAGNKVKVTVTANNTIKNITISEELSDKEEIEDYLIIALNEALEKAKKINEAELAAVAKKGMPNIPGMDLF